MAAPLKGIRVLELAGLAPAPYAGMVLADFGADVVRVDRPAAGFNVDILSRGKRSISVSLKHPEGISLIRTLLAAPTPGDDSWRASVLIDPFRPGVLERLGLDPVKLMEVNPALIVARITGYRRDGPWSLMAGHDINYIARSGVLDMCGRKGERPLPPLNVLGDFAGGGLMAAMGVLLAVIERHTSGKGQVIDVDMITGARYVTSFALLMSRKALDIPIWNEERGSNILDGGCPWYDVYETKDNKHLTVGAIEPQFYAAFLRILFANVDTGTIPSPIPTVASQHDRSLWPALHAFLTASFLTKTRDEWTALYIGTDACVAPVLSPTEVDAAGRGYDEPGFAEGDPDGGVPNQAPILGRTPGTLWTKHQLLEEGFFLEPGRDTVAVLKAAGFNEQQTQRFLGQKVVEDPDWEGSKL